MEVLYAGTTTPLTLNCSVNIDPSLASVVNVSLSWLRGATQLFNGTSRALISPLSESQSVFTSTLTVYPLSTVDSTNFTCRAGIIPQSDRLSSTAASDLGEETVLIIVQGELCKYRFYGTRVFLVYMDGNPLIDRGTDPRVEFSVQLDERSAKSEVHNYVHSILFSL